MAADDDDRIRKLWTGGSFPEENEYQDVQKKRVPKQEEVAYAGQFEAAYNHLGPCDQDFGPACRCPIWLRWQSLQAQHEYYVEEIVSYILEGPSAIGCSTRHSQGRHGRSSYILGASGWPVRARSEKS